MTWAETIASRCRYGNVAKRIWGEWDILWEDSRDDYQGHATLLARKGESYAFYEWWYGSCSGCDGWEADGKDDNAVEREMRETAIWFDNREALKRWLDLLDADPRSNPSMERGGGLAFAIDHLSSGLRGRINAVRAALDMVPLAAMCEPKGTVQRDHDSP